MNKKPIKEILGTEFKNIEGRSAINKIMQEKRGYVENAFHRGNIGNIAVFWGDEARGLCHVVKRRKERGDDLDGLLRNLDLVIKTGKIKEVEEGRFEITKGIYKAVIDSSNYVKSGHFLLTAFIARKKILNNE
jgi:hypothetical protein